MEEAEAEAAKLAKRMFNKNLWDSPAPQETNERVKVRKRAFVVVLKQHWTLTCKRTNERLLLNEWEDVSELNNNNNNNTISPPSEKHPTLVEMFVLFISECFRWQHACFCWHSSRWCERNPTGAWFLFDVQVCERFEFRFDRKKNELEQDAKLEYCCCGGKVSELLQKNFRGRKDQTDKFEPEAQHLYLTRLESIPNRPIAQDHNRMIIIISLPRGWKRSMAKTLRSFASNMILLLRDEFDLHNKQRSRAGPGRANWLIGRAFAWVYLWGTLARAFINS